MYSHGFGTLFLAEAYGMTHRPEIREKLQKAVRLIIDTQNNEGGWRYQPVRRDADLSVTICQINALRAARNAGLFVPKETVENCIRYVKQSQNPDGGFRYMLQGGASAFPRSAAGVVALYSAAVYDTKEVESGIAYLRQYMPEIKLGKPLQPLLLRPLLRRPGDVDPRRRRLERVVSRHPRRADPPSAGDDGLLARQHLQRVRHGDGPDHPSDAQQLPADLPTLSLRRSLMTGATTIPAPRLAPLALALVASVLCLGADEPPAAGPTVPSDPVFSASDDRRNRRFGPDPPDQPRR